MGTDEYIPICEDLHPEDKDNYEINTRTLKAIRLSLEDVEALREAAHAGIVSKKTAEKALKSSGKFIPWQVVTVTVEGNLRED